MQFTRKAAPFIAPDTSLVTIFISELLIGARKRFLTELHQYCRLLSDLP